MDGNDKRYQDVFYKPYMQESNRMQLWFWIIKCSNLETKGKVNRH